MIISLCIPCMNRVRNIKRIMPYVVATANASPPCEITVVDYSSSDGLWEYLERVRRTLPLAEGNTYNFVRVDGRRYYHSTHARNVAVKASHGDCIIQLDAEAMPTEGFVGYIRQRLQDEQPVWMCEKRIGRYIVITRQEFIDSGGYDERFTAYAPEDKDICERLHRRGGRFATFDQKLIGEIQTSNKEKLANLDTKPYENRGIWVKRAMFRDMKKYYEENMEKMELVANQGREWGKWMN